jgi:hypothetical protein
MLAAPQPTPKSLFRVRRPEEGSRSQSAELAAFKTIKFVPSEIENSPSTTTPSPTLRITGFEAEAPFNSVPVTIEEI